MTTKQIVSIVIVIAGVFLTNRLYEASRPSYWRELGTLQDDVLDPDHDKNDAQMGQDVDESRKKDRNKRQFTMDDIESDAKAAIPAADRSARIDLIGKEFEAAAKGHYLKPNAVYLPAYQSSWMATNIPVMSCMLLTAKGSMTYGTYETGPAGVNLDDFTPQNRESYLHWNGKRTTLVKEFPFGAVLGKTCQDAKEKNCGDPFIIGAAAYASPERNRPGYTWVIVNGFVSQTDAVLNGINQVNMSDYNSYKGEFYIEQQRMSTRSCEQQLTSTSP